MKYLLILALAGLSCGLQAPLHYKYKYYGSISTGIPEMSNQASGWAMKADVEVFVEKNDGTAIFKLNNVKTVEFNDKLGCDSRGDIPYELFTKINDEELAHAVEAPFRAHLFDNPDLSIEFPEDKFRWLVNLRKGIVSIFKNAPLQTNVESPVDDTILAKMAEGKTLNVIAQEEDTIFGNCLVEYTSHPLPAHLEALKDRELREHMEIDVQYGEPKSSAAYTSKTTSKSPKKYTSKSSQKTPTKSSKFPAKYTRSDVPEIKDSLWRVIRTVNFDHCKEMVSFQINSVDYTPLDGGQVQWRRGRSSVSEFIFRGTAGQARIESVIVEGATTFAPFGFKTELLQARTNQTLQLVSVTSDGVVPEIPADAKHSTTWMQEVWSFAEPPQYSKPHPWVVYTGEGENMGRFQSYGMDYLSAEEIANIKTVIIEKIKTVSLLLTDMDQEEEVKENESAAHLLQEVSYLFKLIKKEIVLDIFKVFFDKDLHQSDVLAKKLVIDAAAASGYHHAINAVMEYIKEGKIPDLQIMTVFSTLASNAQCAMSVPGILDYVLTLDIREKPFLTSTVLVNFAHLVSEMCVHPGARTLTYPGKLFGDHGCKKQLIKEKFQPYAGQLLQADEDWIKVVGIKILRAIESPFSLQFLTPIVEGKVKCSNRLRIHAIRSLEFWGLAQFDYLKKPIVDLLTDVYSDLGENVAVREAALVTTATWMLDASFYHTIARTSWREPSKRFSSFITSLLKATVDAIHPWSYKQSQAASHAIKFSKPTAFTPFYSNMIWGVTNDHNKHILKMLGGTVQISKSMTDIADITTFMMYDFGGLEVITLHTEATHEFGEHFRLAIHQIKQVAMEDGPTARIARNFYEEIEEIIKSKVGESTKEDSLDLYISILNHVKLFFPISTETLAKVKLLGRTEVGAFMLQLSMGYDLVLGKYFNPIDFTSVLPTELGLPLGIQGSSPIVLTEVSYSSFATGGPAPGLDVLKKSELSIESLISFSSEFQSNIAVLLPFNQKIISAGVTSKRDITLPFKKTLRGDERKDGGHQNIAHFDIQSVYKNKFSVVRASNTPYTSLYSVYPTGEAGLTKIISKPIPEEAVVKIPKKYTGLDLHLTLKSEAYFPLTFFSTLDNFEFERGFLNEGSPLLFYSLASPTLKYWSANLEFNPATSATKNISFEFMTGTFGKDEPEKLTQETGDFSQYGQEGYEQYDQEQQSYSPPSQGFQEFGGNDEVETLKNINYGDSIEQRSQKMQSIFGGKVDVKSFKINFEGDEHRSYELLLSSTKSKSADLRKIKKYQLSLLRSPIPYVDSKPASVCIDTQKSFPIFSKLDSFINTFDKNLNKEIKTEITLGCTGEPVFVAKASLQISESWKKKYINSLPETCDYDSTDPLYTFKRHAVYDDAKITYVWDKVCDPEHFPIMTKVFNFAKQLLDHRVFDYQCGTQEPERKLEVNAHRCEITGNWFADLHRGSQEVKYKNIPHSFIHQFFFGVKEKFLEAYPEHYSTFNVESDKCIVGLEGVRTFDGYVYNYTQSHCWAVAAKNCFAGGNMLLVRSPKDEYTTVEAKYIDINRGLVIEYVRNKLKVNGKIVDPVDDREEIKNSEGNVLVKIYKQKDYYLAKFSPEFYIVFKDTIEVKMWGETCGLCGDSDGEPYNDLVGPQNCYYSDPNLFAASWTGGGDTCDPYELLELRKEAEEYQSSCSAIDKFHDTCPYFNHRCITYGWKVISENENICVSTIPVPYCDDSCDFRVYEDHQASFACWPIDHAPDVLKTAAATHQDSILEPISYEPYFVISKPISVATICKTF